MTTHHTIKTPSGIHIHYLETPSDGPLLIMMHGVTANAHAFDGLLAAGLVNNYHVISIDLRGRGLSDHPATGYSVPENVSDVLAVLHHLGKDKAIFCGHSYGAYLAMYIAAHYPEKVEELILLDAGVRMNPRAAEMLGYRFSHLDIVYPSWHAYLEEIKAAPYNNFWDDAMSSYYRADVRPAEGGGVTPRPYLAHMIESSVGLSVIEWPEVLAQIQAPTLLVHAPDAYNLGEPLLPNEFATETSELIPNCTLIQVPGNHQTMLYGPGATAIVEAISSFATGNRAQ